MFIRVKERETRSGTMCDLVLCESIRQDGRAVQRFIAHLGSVAKGKVEMSDIVGAVERIPVKITPLQWHEFIRKLRDRLLFG